MKRTSFFLVICAMLAMCLTACGTADTNSGTAVPNGDTAVSESMKNRTRAMMDESKDMMNDAKYFAAPDGRVRGFDYGSKLTEGLRSTGKQVTEDMRRVGDTVGNALNDMTH